MRILNRGSSNPPKKPTNKINTEARAMMAGIDQIIVPILPLSKNVVTTDKPIKTTIEIEIQCLQASFNVSHSVSFSGGVKTLAPCILLLSSTWASVKPTQRFTFSILLFDYVFLNTILPPRQYEYHQKGYEQPHQYIYSSHPPIFLFP